MNILVAYASKYGATEGIARRIADILHREGYLTKASPIEQAEHLAAYDAAVLGSAVYYGSWLKEAVEFVHRNRSALALRPVWLFSSGPLGEHVEDGEPQPKEIAELRALLQPRDHRTFFGALDHAKLSFAERMVVKAVRAPGGDFRDWDAIEAWAKGIGSAVSHVHVDTRSA
jgi:menaquinone-dependent protoporphyrinogen oxidase